MKIHHPLIFCVASALSANSALAQSEFVVFPLRYHHAQPATTWNEHLNTPEGKAIASAVGVYFGVDPATTDRVIEGVVGSRETERKGGIRRGEMNVPNGFRYCTTFKVGTQSQSDRAKFALFLRPDQRLLKWNSVVHRHGGVGGRTEFVERDFDVVFISDAVASKYFANGKCDLLTHITKYNEPIIYIQHDHFRLEGDFTRRR